MKSRASSVVRSAGLLLVGAVAAVVFVRPALAEDPKEKPATSAATIAPSMPSKPPALKDFPMEPNRPAPYIAVSPDIPGIGSLFAFRPETAEPMRALAQQILRGPSPLSEGERELIAAYVSRRNECHFCMSSHAGAAASLLKQPYGGLVESLTDLAKSESISPKMRALLAIAGAVQRGGREVTPEHITAAKAAGANDVEIHDTVLVAAAFCMFNRYVDGLASATPIAPEVYEMMGHRLAASGYASLPAAPKTETPR